MKIAFISSGTIRGSLSYRPLAFAKELYKKGHDVYVIAPRFDKYSHFRDEQITEIAGVKILRPLQLRTFPFELGLIPYIISGTIMLLKLKPDIIHIYKSNPVTLLGLLPRLIKKTTLIFDTDDIDSEVMKIEKNSYLKVKLVQFSEKLTTFYASAIIGGSKFLCDLYGTQYKNKIITHIPNGANFTNKNEINLEKNSTKRVIFI